MIDSAGVLKAIMESRNRKVTEFPSPSKEASDKNDFKTDGSLNGKVEDKQSFINTISKVIFSFVSLDERKSNK